MSLDFYLWGDDPEPAAPREAIFVRDNGSTVEISRDEWDRRFPGREPVTALVNECERYRRELFSANITHNLNRMAEAVGIYDCLWRPEEHGLERASQLIEPLRRGLALLEAYPERYKQYDSPNGWGLYIHFVPWVRNVLEACEEHPDAVVGASR